MMQAERDGYVLSDDKSRLDLDAVCALLHATYWASDRPRELIEKSIAHSICLGVFHQGRQVGFSRAVTDHATFTWICDVVVQPEHRGRGLGKWMIECLLAHPELRTTTHVLRTKDAHGFYERFGFTRTEYLRRSVNDWSSRAESDFPPPPT